MIVTALKGVYYEKTLSYIYIFKILHLILHLYSINIFTNFTTIPLYPLIYSI